VGFKLIYLLRKEQTFGINKITLIKTKEKIGKWMLLNLLKSKP